MIMTTEQPTPSPPVAPTPHRRRFAVRRTRVGGWWVVLVLATLVLLFLLIFVLQNGQHVRISFLWMHGNLPLGVALLLAAVGGVLIVAIPGTWRILQLRRLAQGRAADQRRLSNGDVSARKDASRGAPSSERDQPAVPNGRPGS
jgi:uncharacterized integral membrane protein